MTAYVLKEGDDMKQYLICDSFRKGDLDQYDTTAETWDKAKEEAEAMAARFHCKVYVLKVIGVVEGVVSPVWKTTPES